MQVESQLIGASRRTQNGERLRLRRRRLLVQTAVAAVAVCLIALTPSPSLAPAGALRAAAPPAGQVDWPKFHLDASNTGVTSESLLGASSAASLGVSWMANLQGLSYVSPVTGWDGGLNKLLVVAATDSGYLTAFDASTHQPVWSVVTGGVTESTPLIRAGVVYVGIIGGKALRAFDLSSGRPICGYAVAGSILSSPTVFNPDGFSDVIYVGTLSTTTQNGSLYALNPVTPSSGTSACTIRFSYSKWGGPAGSAQAGIWSSPSTGFDALGRPLVIIGTDDPDCSVYALNASTGELVWRFKALNFGPSDVGAGPTISPPGVNGLADGAVYVPVTDRLLYALDLTSGTQLWKVDFAALVPSTVHGGRSTLTLSGNRIYDAFGGIFAFDSTTGAKIWSTFDQGLAVPEVVSSPAVSGAAGDQVILLADTGGSVRAIRAADGVQLWSYKTGGFIYASPAVSNGTVYVTSTDGYLYAFASGGGNSARPNATIGAPANNAIVKYSSAGLMLSGIATDDQAISSVKVAIQRNGTTGPWWNPAALAWSLTPSQDLAVLTAAGSSSSAWTFAFPSPTEGGVLTFFVEAVDNEGQGDPHQPHVNVYVGPAPGQPTVTPGVTTAAPGMALQVTGSGFAVNEKVAIAFVQTQLPPMTADSSGKLSGPLTVPAAALPGLAAVTFAGQTSHSRTSFPLMLSTPWPQFKFSADHSGYEPNEHVFTSVGANQLTPIWTYHSGARIESSPAINGNTAYIGDDGGNVTALDRRTGSVVWTFAAGSGVISSPAIAGGIVLFGTLAGTVYGVDESLGTQRWSLTTNGAVRSSPSVSGGIAYVGTDGGSEYAIDLTTGQVVWSAAIGGVLASSAAVAGDTLYVGSENGNVYAIDIVDASVRWSFHTGGLVDSSPMVSGGVVYVGSADGRVYAIDALTGAQSWLAQTGGPVTSSPTISLGLVLVGSDDRHLYALSSSTGAVVWTYVTGGTVRSSPAAASNMVVFGSSDGMLTAINLTSSHRLWRYQTGAPVTSSVAISDGVVYAASWSGALYAFTPYGKVPG